MRSKEIRPLTIRNRRVRVDKHGEARPRPITFVGVLANDGCPVMPCSGKRARHLLDRGRARVVKYEPFTIQLLDRESTDCLTQPMSVKIDPGSKTTGMAVVTHLGADLQVNRLIDLIHRGDQIRQKMAKRKLHRQFRRSRHTRYRQARFLNRRRKDGWLPPSLQHRVVGVVGWVGRLRRLYPITGIVYEYVKFDTQVMQNAETSGTDYQQGTLQGYEAREYLLEKFGRACVYCDTSRVTRFELDHAEPRSLGGSDRISNLVLSCRPCNQKKGNLPLAVFLKGDPTRLARIRKQLKTPLKDAAATQSTRNALHRELRATGLPIWQGSGAMTKMNRIQRNIPKTHATDAVCTGPMFGRVFGWTTLTLGLECMGRGRYSRTITDKHGFPKSHIPRNKRFFGFATGDIVKVLDIKREISVRGRATVRARGSFVIAVTSEIQPSETAREKIKVVNIVHHRCQLVQRNNGYNSVYYRNTNLF